MVRKLLGVALLAAALSSCASGPLVRTARATGKVGPNAPRITEGGVLFSVFAPDASLVNIAGQFNGWSPEATEMTRDEAGLWSIVLELKPGIGFRYKYLIDGIWLPDPDNPLSEPDGFGGYINACNGWKSTDYVASVPSHQVGESMDMEACRMAEYSFEDAAFAAEELTPILPKRKGLFSYSVERYSIQVSSSARAVRRFHFFALTTMPAFGSMITS